MRNVTLDTDFVNKLQDALKENLPGNASHLKMSSRLRLKELLKEYDTPSATLSGVLITLYPKNGTTNTVFMLRQSYDGVHSGQVSFPGGRKESGDDTLVSTAIREAHEEMNIEPDQLQVLGTLSELYIPPSNYLVLPVVAYCSEVPDFIAEESEVAEIIESDLNFLFDPQCRKETILNVRGYEIEAPYYDVNGHIVWGATAMILSELHDVIKSIT